MSHPAPPPADPSLADVWQLKDIKFHGRDLRIITQNFNGPCSFIAICNILILRGDIDIQPPSRQHVSYEFLSQLVADYLLRTSPDADVSAALSIMPKTQRGMDLNPVFTSATSFRPSALGDGDGGELKLFQQVGISLLHGWLVDPDSAEAPVLARVGDYDSAVALIAEADHLTDGRLVMSDHDIDGSTPESGSTTSPTVTREYTYTEEERQKIRDATVVRHFLATTPSQLTYHGLFHLAAASALPPPGVPCALFRGAHLAVLYKHAASPPSALRRDHATSPAGPGPGLGLGPGLGPSSAPGASTNPAATAAAGGSSSSAGAAPSLNDAPESYPYPYMYADGDGDGADSALYTLVTDQVFVHEPSVVWERLEDVDGGSAAFVDADFARSSPAGGDYAGQTAEEALRVAEAADGRAFQGIVDPNDLALAHQLQAEEEQIARQAYMDEVRAHDRLQQRRQDAVQRQIQIEQEEKEAKLQSKKKGKKKGDCIIM